MMMTIIQNDAQVRRQKSNHPRTRTLKMKTAMMKVQQSNKLLLKKVFVTEYLNYFSCQALHVLYPGASIATKMSKETKKPSNEDSEDDDEDEELEEDSTSQVSMKPSKDLKKSKFDKDNTEIPHSASKTVSKGTFNMN